MGTTNNRGRSQPSKADRGPSKTGGSRKENLDDLLSSMMKQSGIDPESASKVFKPHISRDNEPCKNCGQVHNQDERIVERSVKMTPNVLAMAKRLEKSEDEALEELKAALEKAEQLLRTHKADMVKFWGIVGVDMKLWSKQLKRTMRPNYKSGQIEILAHSPEDDE